MKKRLHHDNSASRNKVSAQNLSLKKEQTEDDSLENSESSDRMVSNRNMVDTLQERKVTYFRDVNLKIKPSQKVGLVGEEDSGVREFFDALLGENYITKGIVR